jgi:DNA replication and repair protein RecF
MYLNKLSLLGFKNYAEADFEFSKNINCFVGNNGEGKTNLLDSIHYLAFCKSFFNPNDSQNIFHNNPFFVIQGEFINSDNTKDEIYCGFKRNEKKQFKKNKKEYARLAEHIGSIPLVMVSPADSELITEGSDSRRKFMDSAIAQFNKQYLENLLAYNKILAHRNAVLKNFAEARMYDKETIAVWDEQLIAYGNKIHLERQKFIEKFIPIFNTYYQLLSGDKEQVGIEYASQLNTQKYEALLETAVKKDLHLQYTSVGIHKDDLDFKIGNFALKKFGSQGQQKSFLIALKLAQFDFLKNIKQKTPIILLDDIYDKLDESRVQKLMEIVSSQGFGQIFITDTHQDRIARIFKKIKTDFKLFKIKGGNKEA